MARRSAGASTRVRRLPAGNVAIGQVFQIRFRGVDASLRLDMTVLRTESIEARHIAVLQDFSRPRAAPFVDRERCFTSRFAQSAVVLDLPMMPRAHRSLAGACAEV